MHALVLALLLQTIDAKELETLADRVIAAEMQKHKIPATAFVMVQNGKVVLAKGYGAATTDTIFQIGSITKVFTFLGVVQLADRGAIDLDTDVNRYLKTIRVPDGPPVTAKHLLTHTAGLDELRGRRVPSAEERVQPLDRFLKTRLVRVHPPGAMTSYSSFGAALAGQLVEDAGGMPFERWLACNVWAPLAMHRTQITIPESLLADAAIAYEPDESGKVAAIPWERYHTPPASSISSTASDMSRFMIAVLAQDPRVMSKRAWGEMTRQQVTMHPRVPGFAYGLQVFDTNGQRILEHGGNIGGFSSMMTLLPDHGTGFFIVNNFEGSDLRSLVRKAILDRWFPHPNPAPPPKADPAAAPRLKKLQGTYRANIYCHTCPHDPARVIDVPVTANGDGSITVWDERWIEVEPLFFRSADGKRRIGFHQDAKGNITALTSGSWMVLEKLP